MRVEAVSALAMGAADRFLEFRVRVRTADFKRRDTEYFYTRVEANFYHAERHLRKLKMAERGASCHRICEQNT
jgi:hypothetical protein